MGRKQSDLGGVTLLKVHVWIIGWDWLCSGAITGIGVMRDVPIRQMLSTGEITSSEQTRWYMLLIRLTKSDWRKLGMNFIFSLRCAGAEQWWTCRTVLCISVFQGQMDVGGATKECSSVGLS